MPEKQQKVNTTITNSFKFLANLQDDQINDPNYIPENMQPYIGAFLRNKRKQFDDLDKKIRTLDRNSDDYTLANKEIEKIAKSFITLRRQVDTFKTSQGTFKNLIPNINQGTKAENMHINAAVLGEQADEFIIGDDGRMNFVIDGSSEKYHKLDNLQDNFPIVTEPFNAKSYIYEKYEETQLNRDLGKVFDEGTEYNKILYNIGQGGSSDIIGLAHTDAVGDGSVSFADMWESGLEDKDLYVHPQTGEKLPKDNKWMKDEANSDVLQQLLAKHFTNTMRTVSGTKPVVTVRGVSDDSGLYDKSDLEEPDKKVELPEVTVSDTKADKKTDKEIEKHFKDTTSGKGFDDKIKTMSPKLFKDYMSKLEAINKKAELGSKKDKKFLKTLPGGDYYDLLKQMKVWRKYKLSPAELIKKYSK